MQFSRQKFMAVGLISLLSILVGCSENNEEKVTTATKSVAVSSQTEHNKESDSKSEKSPAVAKDNGSAKQSANETKDATANKQDSADKNGAADKKVDKKDAAANSSDKDSDSASANSDNNDSNTKAEIKQIELHKSELFTIKKGNIYDDLPIYGTLMPKDTVRVTAPVMGTVASVNYDVGDKVKKGDVLVNFDKAALQSSLSSTQASVDGLKAQLKNAQLTYDRSVKLAKDGYVSEAVVQNNETTLENLKSQLRKAEESNNQTKQQLAESSVIAPISGVISSRSVNIGQTVGAGTAIMGVVDISKMSFQANVSSSKIARVSVGQEAVLQVFGVEGLQFLAKVTRISPVVEENSRSFPVYFEVDNQEGFLKGGMFADGAIMVNLSKNIFAVPSIAVGVERNKEGKKVYYVYKAVKGKIEKHPVTIGELWQARGLVQLTSGVKEGDQVISASIDDSFINASYKIMQN